MIAGFGSESGVSLETSPSLDPTGLDVVQFAPESSDVVDASESGTHAVGSSINDEKYHLLLFRISHVFRLLFFSHSLFPVCVWFHIQQADAMAAHAFGIVPVKPGVVSCFARDLRQLVRPWTPRDQRIPRHASSSWW